MSQLPREPMVASPRHAGSTGQRASFLDECWELADPGGSGQRGVNGVSAARLATPGPRRGVVDPADPALPRGPWGNQIRPAMGKAAALTREPTGEGKGATPPPIPDMGVPPHARRCLWHHADAWWWYRNSPGDWNCGKCHPPARPREAVWWGAATHDAAQSGAHEQASSSVPGTWNSGASAP